MSALLNKLRRRPSHEYPPYQHLEQHFESAEIVRDTIIGLSDGLTVPFALAAGLSSLGSSKLVIYGGAAELVSGAISMGLGGYLAARSEIEHYRTERLREEFEVEECPQDEEEEIVEILEPYGLDRETIQPLIDRLKSDPQKFVDFMMKFELNLECPDPRRSWISALTIGLSYFLGGLIPLMPYFFIDDAMLALYVSVAVTSLTLLIFGYIKSRLVNPNSAVWGAIQTLLIGAVAAGASYGIVYLLPQEPGTSLL
ncbi:Ccc1 family [Gilbertella persicaria]|uniref:Ccc1 family n=1 Tax=Gilbertella persicaria TaxID=101096 RepID=UPI0022200EB3|nr:Ccc1 family [Gilbertella persicaria]KAI8067019.1 Ccc1 family [Gilbertella persicaria]